MNIMQSSSDPKEKFVVNVITGQGGSGHYATYHAIRAVAEQQHGWHFQVTDMDEIIADLAQQNKVKNAYEMLGFSGHDLYNLMQKSGWTWLWPLKMRLNKFLVKLNYDAGVKIFEEYWHQQQPDLVISVMPLYNKGLSKSLQKAKPDTPYVTILTDLADYPPAFWIEPKTDNYTICGTEKAVEQARSLGVKEERIIQTSGMVIHPRFYKQIENNRSAERQRLGLAPDCLTGLVMFGGNGSKAMLEIAKRLECFGEKLQLIFLCGRNQELAETLRNNQSSQKKLVISFTEEVPFYMHLADFFIGKPGPGSLSEALVMQLPVIVERNAATLIHERYNTEWVEQQQVGVVIPSFRNIDKAVEQFLEPKNFDIYRSNVAALNNRAVFEITDYLQQILAKSHKTKVTQTLIQR
ncbi:MULTISPECIES: MGDG synthase family glycosyltransferase [unclassified Nostoc]|uniref:MGDG synthase family glycosyltransferase n=1 Tax=unclassified Nostoc TaxID=2593658 RepID=UPI001F555C1D|nr:MULTISPECIES: glycosyltransferase [unclassified Nostoc]